MEPKKLICCRVYKFNQSVTCVYVCLKFSKSERNKEKKINTIYFNICISQSRFLTKVSR